MTAIRIRLLVAAMAVLFATAITRAQSAEAAPPPMHGGGQGHEMGMGMDHMLGFFADYLNLTDAQQEQIKAVMHKEHAALKPLMQQERQFHQQMRQYEEGTYDEAKVRALATQQAQTLIELSVQKTRIHNELFQLLTADQQAKMKEMEARHEARMQKHMGEAPPAPEQ
jgi:Spy/CpxP family protein refolding chaperone